MIIKKWKTNQKEILKIKFLFNIDVSVYYHTIDQDGLNHVENRHGKKSKEKEDKIITEKDIKEIQNIVENCDDISGGGISNSRKLLTIRYKKNIKEYEYFYLVEILKNKKELRIKTLYKNNIKK